MGTASTMTSALKCWASRLPGARVHSRADSRHAQMATLTGKRIVEMVWEDRQASTSSLRDSFDNAVTAVLALGGSTNAIVHLIAMARRAGVRWTSSASTRWRARRRCWPTCARSGKYLMEGFLLCGGLRGFLSAWVT
jgi:dihydroxy-acid dehydratase